MNRHCEEPKFILGDKPIHKQGRAWISDAFCKKSHFSGLPHFEQSSRSQ
jgi:hypothetical protein